MKITKALLFIVIFCCSQNVIAQNENEIDQIKDTLLDYIEGTASGEAERLDRAFHQDLNLYHVSSDDSLVVWPGSGYINNFRDGRKRNRIGKIVNIDYSNDAASAKIEVDMPGLKRLYTDYLLLLKIGGEWKIIHKTFTYEDYPE